MLFVASEMLFDVNVLKNFSTRSIAKLCSLMIMHVAFSFVNFGSNVKPRFVKKFIDL
jgi:hypothetical protein